MQNCCVVVVPIAPQMFHVVELIICCLSHDPRSRSAVLGANSIVPIDRGALEPRLNTLIDNLRRWRGDTLPMGAPVRPGPRRATLSLGPRAVSLELA
jgi:hypothetical protein